PRRVVSDYSPEELASFREAFRPVAERQRRYQTAVNFFIGISFGCMLLGAVLPKRFASALFDCLFASVLTFILILVLLWRSPLCAACQNRLDNVAGPYCPECGSKTLRPGDWFHFPHCTTCGRKLSPGKYRDFTIRACTHCGVFLH